MTREKHTSASYGYRILINTASHPLEYAKILMQLGYEPLAPRSSMSFFGRPVLKLPNILQYVGHIKSVSGITGCYSGFFPKICGNLVGQLAGEKAVEHLCEPEEERTTDSRTEDEVELDTFLSTLRKDLVAHTAAIIASHPFHVITVRTMAQFIGHETRYSGVFSSIGIIYKENGIGGFFSGLIPRLLGDLCALVLGSTLAFALTKYLLEDKELKVYSSITGGFIATTVTYPFLVVSNCMAVSGSGLAAGKPPHMPYYTSWTDCWTHLSKTNNLKRGSSLFLRYYNGPQVVIDGKAVPTNKDEVFVYQKKLIE